MKNSEEIPVPVSEQFTANEMQELNSCNCGNKSKNCQHNCTGSLPLVIEARKVSGNLDTLIGSYKNLEEDLGKHGGILFRGFGIDTVDNFNSFMKCFNNEPIPYMFRSSPRHSVSDRVYVSTTYPENRTINMHSESSYSYAWGRKIIFCCLTPAAEQGETPIADNRKVLERLDKKLVEKFEEKGVLYQRNLSPEIGMPWEEVFQTSDAEAVKKMCDENNISYQFLSPENLILRWKKPAICLHPGTKERIWFNHSYFFNRFSLLEEMGLPYDDTSVDDFLPSDTFYGDGSPITLSDYLQIKEAYDNEKVIFPWQKGDVLLLDNMLVAHGRNPYKGDRRIVVSIIEPHFGPNIK